MPARGSLKLQYFLVREMPVGLFYPWEFPHWIRPEVLEEEARIRVLDHYDVTCPERMLQVEVGLHLKQEWESGSTWRGNDETQ